MSESKKFLKSSSHYLVNQIVMLTISLISFPIIVRLLSVEEYGVLSLCNTILLLGVALSKMGLQNSIIRFYPEYKKENNAIVFYRTFLLTAGVLGFVFYWISGGITLVSLRSEFNGVAWLVAAIVLFQTLFSYLSNFLRCQERSLAFAVLTIIARIISAGGGIALILLFHEGIYNLLHAQILGNVVVVFILFYLFRKDFFTKGSFFSTSLFSSSLAFGLPLVAFELSSIALAFSDRFLINYFNGTEQLGIYAVGYTLCMYVGDLIRQPLSMAVGPMYTRIYDEYGETNAADFLSELGSLVALIALPVFFGCVAVSDDLIALVATDKYLTAAPIIPWVLGGFLLYACQPLIAAGLLLKKKTSSIAIISLIGGGLNICANAVLLPKYGIIAAAWSTLGSYVVAIFLMGYMSSKHLKVRWPYVLILKYSACAIIMYLIVIALPDSFNLFIKIFVGVISYPTFIICCDKKIRSYIISTYENKKSNK